MNRNKHPRFTTGGTRPQRALLFTETSPLRSRGSAQCILDVINLEPEPEREGVVDETDVRKVSVLCKSYDMARDKRWNENMFLMEGTT